MLDYMLCISKTACFPVNYAPHSLQVWEECNQWSYKALSGYRSLNVVNDMGRNRTYHCRDCLSQSEAFPPLSPGHSTTKPGRDVMLPIKGSANALSGHLVLALGTGLAGKGYFPRT